MRAIHLVTADPQSLGGSAPLRPACTNLIILTNARLAAVVPLPR